MEDQEEHYERIEQYLAGSLPIGERQTFEREIQQNSVLAREVELHRQLQEAIQSESQDTLMTQAIKKAASDYFADEPQGGKVISMPSSGPRWYWLAASIGLALLIGGGVYFMNHSALSDQQLFDSNFTVYEAPVLFRSGDSTESPTLQMAFVAYNQKEYQKAADLFAKRLEEPPRQIVPHFYIGQCNLALNNPKVAIPAFQKVIDHGDNAYLEQAKWYLALAYLDINSGKQATPLLRELSQQTGPFRERASLILQELTDDN